MNAKQQLEENGMVIALLEADLLVSQTEIQQLRLDIKSACDSRELQIKNNREITVQYNQRIKQNLLLGEELTRLKQFNDAFIPILIDEWHEDKGDVLWWSFPIQEPPYCGSPLDSDWPDYHTMDSTYYTGVAEKRRNFENY
ncbi:hypothetical protein [Paenibacillus qinlingensis]|uniref:hypothetical protein n=1 Tax=Paenibacillus qinlingensis TaxID=1837343 RepID=UPI00156363B1|nr:hypothetical protein [Paenibacillus qinlingensis]NQX57525.1 hypothetical protein [Paenibacillus qinlingensis]